MKLWQGALITFGSALVVVALGVCAISVAGDCRLVQAMSRETYEFSDPRLGGARVVSKPRIEQVRVLVCGTVKLEDLELRARVKIDGGAGP